MAQPLKDLFGPEMVHRTASMISAVDSTFDVDGFTTQALDGFDDLELTQRCQHIADAMATHLSDDRTVAIETLLASLGPELENCDPADAAPTGDPEIDDNVMSGFFYMPHGYFLAAHGGDHLDLVLRANYEITKRATSEFSIRTPLRDHPEPTLAALSDWSHDSNVHVRRLVSEGTRPRLPWGFRLTALQEDPSPILPLLETLKDDPVEYVRRSVANNLNDIAKDHPDLVVDVARRWWADADSNRKRLIRHGLRSLIKAGHPGALDVIGYGASSSVAIATASIDPPVAEIGQKVEITLNVHNPSDTPDGALIDIRIQFVKANGSTTPKVFKGAEILVEPGETAVVKKAVSVAQHSTRKHYPGTHTVEVMINGSVETIGSFELVE